MEVVNYEQGDATPPFARTLEEINREFVKFVFCSHKHFVYLQRYFSNGGGNGFGDLQSAERKRAICESSGTFREHLVNLKDELIYLFEDAEQELLQGAGESEEEENNRWLDCLMEALEVADSTQTLWHFLEFMVLQPSHATWAQTADWLKLSLSAATPVDLSAVLTQLSTTDCPEFISDNDDSGMAGISGEGSAGDGTGFFWRTLMSLVSLGRLDDAWAVLQLHSELAEALRDPRSRHHSAAQLLADVFTSHPSVLLPLADTDPELYSDPAFLREHVGAWQAWTGRVRALLARPPVLLTGLPPLLRLLRFFVGDEDVMQPGEEPPVSWQQIALQRLMYSPCDSSHARLSRQDVGRVLLEAISLSRQRAKARGEGEESPAELRYTEVVTSLLKQELGDFLTFCAAAPSWELPPRDQGRGEHEQGGGLVLLSDVFVGMTLVNTMHVAALLQLSGELSTDPSTAQGKFVAQRAVAGCAQLKDMHFPIEICSLYLETLCSPADCHHSLQALFCPVKAAPTDISILGALQAPHSDEAALQLSRALLSHGDALLAEAQSVLVTRGLFWLQRGVQAKALFFFAQAQAHSRAAALLDDSFQRCVVAFCRHLGSSSSSNRCAAGKGGGALQASLWSLDALAVDYKRCSDIHSTTSRLYTSCSEAANAQDSGADSLVELERELSVAAALLGVMSCHPRYPQLARELEQEQQGGGERGEQGGRWGGEEAAARTLATYARLLRALLRYQEAFESSPADQALLTRGSLLLQGAACQVQRLLQPENVSAAPSACVSSMEVCISQRYWLHVVDLSVWINKQSTLLHKCCGGGGGTAAALFRKEEADKLRRLLLLGQLSYVPSPLTGRGARPDGALLRRECKRPGQHSQRGGEAAPYRTKELDDFDAYEMDLHTELLDMQVQSLCLDNQLHFSPSPPPSASSSAPSAAVAPPSQYAHPSSRSLRTNAAVHRYLSAPVALQSWRRELLS